MNTDASLQVLDCRIYRGPHLYSNTPMIRIQVDLGVLENWPTNLIAGFTEKLVSRLPGLNLHGCSFGVPGGFITRLQEGTWMGHVIEHVAIELQSMAGLSITRGKTRSVKGKPGCYNIMYAYTFEKAGLYAGRLALDLIESLLGPKFARFTGCDLVYPGETSDGFDFDAGMKTLKQLVENEKLGPTTQSLVDEAVRRNIPWRRLDGDSLIQLGTGRYQKLIRASITGATSNIAVDAAGDKELTKDLLSQLEIPVPEGQVVTDVEAAMTAATEIGFPVVVKPYDGNHGRGVATDLKTPQDIANAFPKAQDHSNSVIVEKHYNGQDYRVLVINGEVVAVAERLPAHVIGNGINTISQLIEMINADPRRGNGHECVMTKIKKDDAVKCWLARSGLTLDTVPAKDQKVVLVATANLSTGGTAIDRTDQIHPHNASIARRAALALGLDVAGIDFVSPDIAQSWREVGGGIVEVNAAPGFRMHLQPSQGQARNVAKPVISSLFPEGAKTRVPVVAVTGTNGKSTTVRMVAHILRESGLRVGFTSTSGVYIDDECLWEGDASGPRSARLLLRDSTIDVAVLETARGGILREGLGVPECDVGAVLNVTADHLGIGGIETVDDLATVKSVITEAVHSKGVSVLNADDKHTLEMAQYAGGKLCYFSMHPAKNAALQEHIEKGGQAVIRESIAGKDQIVFYKDNKNIPVIGVNDIPATSFGNAVFNVENALAVVAIAHGLGIDFQVISTALKSFVSSYEQNPGRFNIHDMHGFRVIMDYAHNPAALHALFGTIREMRKDYKRVIGHVGVPGDRRDEDIREVGRIVGKEFDMVVFRERPDTRGRPDGEIVGLLSEAAQSVGCKKDNIICVYPEEEATEICLENARPGDIVILTPSDIHKTWKQVLNFKPAFNRTEKKVAVKEKIDV